MHRLTGSAHAVLCLAATAGSAGAADVTAHGDITAHVLANDNIVLDGDATVTLPAAYTRYDGVLSGAGTLTLAPPDGTAAAAGTGEVCTLAITKAWSVRLPDAQLVQHAVQTHPPGGYAVTIIGVNPPVLTVRAGVTFQIGCGDGAIDVSPNVYSGTASDGGTQANGQVNFDNLQIDGRLSINNANGGARLGMISGTGSVMQTTAATGTWFLGGSSTFSGVLQYYGGGFYGGSHIGHRTPIARAIVNEGSMIVSGPADNATIVDQDVFESHYGDDINTGVSTAIFRGVYSYSDNSPHTVGNLVDPGLGDPDLNYQVVVNDWSHSFHPAVPTNEQYAVARNGSNASFRGNNIEGGGQRIQWGDGTHARFFLPATPNNSYINLHNGSTLALCYSGTVILNTPIAGGGIGVSNASLGATGVGNVLVTAAADGYAPGEVVFGQPMFYNGSTTIAAGATLVLGRGSPWVTKQVTVRVANDGSLNKTYATLSTYSGDGSLLTALSTSRDDGTALGAATDAIIDQGTLVVNNTETAITLTHLSGSGGLVQRSIANAAALSGMVDTANLDGGVSVLFAKLIGAHPEAPTVTLRADTPYSGSTTIEHGTIAIAADGSIAASSGVTLSNADACLDVSAASQTIQTLAGTAGTIALGASTLTIGSAADSSFAGSFRDGGIAGGSNGALRKQGTGTLTLDGPSTHTGGTTIDQGAVIIGDTRALGAGAVTNRALLATASGQQAVTIAGDFTQGATGTLRLKLAPGTPDTLTVQGAAHLGGALVVHATGSFTAGQVYTLLATTAGVGSWFATLICDDPSIAITTTGDGRVIATVQTAGTAAGATASLSATAGTGRVTLAWSAVAGATAYELRRSALSGGPYTAVGSTTHTTFTDSGLGNGAAYFYVVDALTGSTAGPASVEVGATPIAAPTSLSASAGDGEAALHWSPVSGASGYTVLAATAAGGPYALVGTGITTTAWTEHGLVNGTPRFYVVTAETPSGSSDPSNEAQAVPSVPATAAGNDGGGHCGSGIFGLVLAGMLALGLRGRRT